MDNGAEARQNGDDMPPPVRPGGRRERRTSTRLLVFAGSSWLRIAATFLVTIYLGILLYRHLGVELAGLHLMLAFMTRFLTPVRAALARVMTREIAGALAVDDQARVTRIFSNAVVLSTVGAGVAFLLMGTLSVFVVQVFTVPAPYAGLASLAIWCETAILTSFLFFNPWLNLLLASQRVLAENIARTTERWLDLFAAMIAFWALPAIPAFASAHPFVSFTVARAILRIGQHVSRALVGARLVSAARVRLELINKRDLRSLSTEGGWSLGNATANVGFYVTDQPFVNVFFGLTYNALFAIVTRLQGMGQMLGNNVAFGLEAMVADHHEMGRHDLNKRIMLTGMRVTSSITVFCTVCVVLLAPQIVDLWLGKELKSDPAIQAMGYERALELIWAFGAILLPIMWFSQAMLVSTRVLYGMGHNRLFSPWLMAAAGLKIVIAWVGLQFFGAGPLWVAWSTVIAQVWCFGWVFPRLIKKVFDVSMVRVFAETYALPLLSTIPSALVILASWRLVTSWSLEHLIVVLFVAGVVYAPAFFFVALRADERGRLIHLAKLGPRAAMSQVRGGRRKKKGAQSGDEGDASGGDAGSGL